MSELPPVTEVLFDDSPDEPALGRDPFEESMAPDPLFERLEALEGRLVPTPRRAARAGRDARRPDERSRRCRPWRRSTSRSPPAGSTVYWETMPAGSSPR